MLIHRGKIFREFIDRYCAANECSITWVAKKAGYDQSTIYRHFEKAELPYHIIYKYGKALEHDFSIEFPEMTDEFEMIKETENRAVVNDLEECTRQRDYWMKKYVDLLEKHNALLMNKLSENQ